MKIDLITVFPGIVLETKKSDWGENVLDPDLSDDIAFNGSRIVSYKQTKEKSDSFDDRHIKLLDELHNTIIDAAGNSLNDYTIIIEKSVESRGLDPPTLDSQQLLTYFAYQQRLDIWIIIDTVKIFCYEGRGRIRFVNNFREHFGNYLYMLPLEQEAKGKVRLREHREIEILKALSILLDNDPDRYRALINAIALFNESCRILNVSPNSAVILIVSAMESLLELPQYPKKKTFSYAVKLLCGFDKRIEMWAEELYTLRSQIVHGDVIKDEKLLASKDRHYPHFSIARQLFHGCFLLLLETQGTTTLDFGSKQQFTQKIRNIIVSNKEKVNTILKKRRKYTFNNMVRDKNLYKELLSSIEELTPTDYSAEANIGRLFDLIFSIVEDWIADIKSNDSKKVSREMHEYLSWQEKKYENIVKIFGEIKKLKRPLEGRFELNEKQDALAEEVRNLSIVFHDRNVFEFTIAEFLDRFIRAMFAVY